MHHLDLAFKLADQVSNCRERREGCVICDAKGRVLATGAAGFPNRLCKDCGCRGYCQGSHAEARAINGLDHRINRARSLHATHAPCPDCINMLIGTPITEIVFAIDDPSTPSCMLWERAGRTWTQAAYNPHRDSHD